MDMKLILNDLQRPKSVQVEEKRVCVVFLKKKNKINAFQFFGT